MLYEAKIDSDTLTMFDRATGEALDAVAVIPGHAPDLVALVNMLPPSLAADLEHLAGLRASGAVVSTDDVGV
ncbi:hypothetical protein [Luteimonas mephitis]|uniref:hypothetical protein n=1 Tax=Luteimonas mephitis TaxID=83615 RepID=UPI003A8D3F4D